MNWQLQFILCVVAGCFVGLVLYGVLAKQVKP